MFTQKHVEVPSSFSCIYGVGSLLKRPQSTINPVAMLLFSFILFPIILHNSFHYNHFTLCIFLPLLHCFVGTTNFRKTLTFPFTSIAFLGHPKVRKRLVMPSGFQLRCTIFFFPLPIVIYTDV